MTWTERAEEDTRARPGRGRCSLQPPGAGGGHGILVRAVTWGCHGRQSGGPSSSGGGWVLSQLGLLQQGGGPPCQSLAGAGPSLGPPPCVGNWGHRNLEVRDMSCFREGARTALLLAAGGPAPGGCGHPGGGAGSEPCTGVTSTQVAGSGVRNVPGPLTASLWSREHSATWGPGGPRGCLPRKEAQRSSLRSCRTATLLESRQGRRILQMRKCQFYGQPGRGGFRWQLVRLVGRVASEQWVPTPSWAQVIDLPPADHRYPFVLSRPGNRGSSPRFGTRHLPGPEDCGQTRNLQHASSTVWLFPVSPLPSSPQVALGR